MKPFAELTTEDLRRSPVWRYKSADGDADAAVEEDDRPELTERDPQVFVASTTFHLSDGSSFPGLCSPVDPSGLDYLQPVILAPGRHVPLWGGVDGARPVVEAVSRELGRSLSEVFPLSFTCHAPVDGAVVSGTIDLGGALPNQALQLTVNLLPFGRSGDRS